MSQYTAIEAAAEALVLSYNDGETFTAENTARGDWRVLGKPGNGVACVLSMAEPSEQGDRMEGHGAHGQRMERHAVHIGVYVRIGSGIGGPGVAYETLTALTDALDTHLRRYPRLNNTATVERAEVTGITTVEDVAPNSAPTAPTHLRQEIRLMALCKVPLNLVEVAG